MDTVLINNLIFYAKNLVSIVTFHIFEKSNRKGKAISAKPFN